MPVDYSRGKIYKIIDNTRHRLETIKGKNPNSMCARSPSG